MHLLQAKFQSGFLFLKSTQTNSNKLINQLVTNATLCFLFKSNIQPEYPITVSQACVAVFEGLHGDADDLQ